MPFDLILDLDGIDLWVPIAASAALALMTAYLASRLRALHNEIRATRRDAADLRYVVSASLMELRQRLDERFRTLAVMPTMHDQEIEVLEDKVAKMSREIGRLGDLIGAGSVDGDATALHSIRAKDEKCKGCW